MTPIHVVVTALGQTFRVEGRFEPSSPAIVSGPPDNWEPADPAVWDEHTITLADGEDDLAELLERVWVRDRAMSAADHIRDLAEHQWLRDQDAGRWEDAA